MSAARTGVSAVASSSEPVKAPTRDFVVMEVLPVSPDRDRPLGVHISAAAWRNPCGRRDAGIATEPWLVYRLNTNSIEAVEVFLSSGKF